MGVALVAAFLASAGCATTLTRLAEVPPEYQLEYRGTEPGWHRLSPYFAVSISEKGSAVFYHFREPQNPKTKEVIGKQRMYWPTETDEFLTYKQKFGPRMNAYAQSEDGRSLLFFTDGTSWSKLEDFSGRLHLFRHGLADSVIASDLTHRVWRPDHSLVLGDAVVYRPADKHGHQAIRGLWSEGAITVRSVREFVSH